ncbi:MAG: orotate phosphoribosyltransferase [Crocinitomicaceae bacterium]|jgi:orotate phosphoribosyltransferase|nr:orotate phosphoribosyltransferase [Crocinitomicaceae bacterium]
MKLNNDRAYKLAEFLLQIKAIKLQPTNPFTWASGWKSPIYCDNRKTLSFPKVRTYIRQSFSEMIVEKFGKPDIIAGVATGGIAHGVLVAQDLGLPFVYVRSTPKGHGLGNQIEGYFEEGQSVVVIEDLISTGGSSLEAVKALKEAKLNVKGLAAIFTYGFEESVANFKQVKCPFETLTNYDFLMEQAVKKKYIGESDTESLIEWRKNPAAWMQ